MNELMLSSYSAGLDSHLKGYGIFLSDAQRMALLEHLMLVFDKNREMNLTRIDTMEHGLILHILDSLLLLPCLDHLGYKHENYFVDLGTGAGFPGIPLAIATGMSGLLIDSVGKKAHAVEGFIHTLSLSGQLSAKGIRAEDLARRKAGAFDYVSARAVAELPVLVEYASPLLRKSGCLVSAKANIQDNELEAADKTAYLCGMKRVSRETFELPDGLGHREVIAYRKTARACVKLPRKNGMAKHRPLFLGARRGD